MSGNISALQAIWPTLTGSTAQKLSALNVTMVPGTPQDITIAALENFLITNNLLNPVTTYVSKGTNQLALIGCNYLLALLASPSPVLATSQPANFLAIQQLGSGLLADPATGVTAAHLSQMIGMIAPSVPWWQANGFSAAVSVTDLIAAGDLY
jgi:hypothetical protein